MNSYQKFSVYVFRLVGIAVAIGGLRNLVTADYLRSGMPPHHFSEYFWLNTGYVVAGVFVILMAKQMGRLLGKGLD